MYKLHFEAEQIQIFFFRRDKFHVSGNPEDWINICDHLKVEITACESIRFKNLNLNS